MFQICMYFTEIEDINRIERPAGKMVNRNIFSYVYYCSSYFLSFRKT